MVIRAMVQSGRIVVDEPTSLPDGTVLNLVVEDEGDDLSPDERAALHAHLEASWRSVEEGRTRPASELLAELRARRR
jgi:hypothetical protein